MMTQRWQNNSNSTGHSFGFLALVFLFFFVVPVLFIGPAIRSNLFEDSASFSNAGDVAFDAPVAINGRGAFLKVPPSDLLGPQLGKDFLVVAWFNIQDLPVSGQRMFLLSRFESSSPSKKSGYAIAISRTIDALRPEVYWRDERGRGGWYPFSDVHILPGYWFMLGLVFYDDSKLGLFVGSYDGDGRVSLQPAGGYKLEAPIIPKSDLALKVGSVKTGLFTGNIGPVGMFSGEGLGGDVRSIMKGFLKSPLSLPDRFDQTQVLFWTPDARNDLSSHHHTIKLVDPVKDKDEDLHDF